MASGLCKVTIIGRLSRDPEMRYTQGGKAVTSFNVPVNRTFTGQDGERKEETEWFRVNAWGRLAETCNNFLKKGSQVYIEGRLSSRVWQDRDGKDRFSMEVFANEMQMLDRVSEAGRVGAGTNGDLGAEDLDADDLPF